MHFRIRTWVSQFCLFSRFSRETEKKRYVRGKTGKTEGKEILFVLEATPISIVASHKCAATVSREYINFVSSRNCTPVRFKSHLLVFLASVLRPERDKNE